MVRSGRRGGDLRLSAAALAQGGIVVTAKVSDFEPADVEIEDLFRPSRRT
ncbi:MAG: hypothetical protein OXH79_22780 [Boseongicola sp.]|nr:hypothetical protein [Boseongicola sp.]